MRIPLSRLAMADAVDTDVLVSPGIERSHWLARVAAWRDAFSTLASRDIALACDDALEFSAALFGGWQAGVTPWLPGDALPATLGQLHERGLLFAGDLPDGIRASESIASTDSGMPALDADSCKLVLFTSGSTGEPAAIRKSLRQLDAEVDALESVFGPLLDADAVVHATVSHQHIYGLLFRILWPLSSGRTFAPARIAYNEQLTTLGASPIVLVASPAHLKRLPDTQDWQPLASNLRAVFSSGGPLPLDAALTVQRLWRQAAIEVFGSTETGGIAWRRGDGSRAPWQPLPGVEWRVQDGLLDVRSPHLPSNEWWSTSDRAHDAGDGRFELLGRADRIVKLEERRISLDAIQTRLQGSDLLDEVRVLALPGHRILLAVAAVPSENGQSLLDAEGRPALVERLRAWLAGHCDPIALPRRWRFLDAWPADARGKTRERDLAALFRPLMPTPDWQLREDDKATASLLATAELAAFEGHFPQVSVLPGVVLVDWAVRLGREAFGFVGEIQCMEALKFQQLVRPDTLLTAELDWRPGQLGFRFTSARGAHASGRLRFGDAP
ncbi:AMP-binding protein [Thermomonas carbonis]|nr:AMP-binding protein [Thermomonas carbonis]